MPFAPKIRSHHDGRGGAEVGTNGGEVERRDAGHKALERAILESIPHVRAVVLRLLRVDLVGVAVLCRLGG